MTFTDLTAFILGGVVLTGWATVHAAPRVDADARHTRPHFLEEAPRAQLLFLGVFHFADQGLDVYKPRFHLDITSPERQRQVEELVEGLALFRPTKVAIEADPQLQARLDSLYGAYLKGIYPLGENEVYQLGFRLAKRLGLPRVWAADAEARAYMTDSEARAKMNVLGLSMDTVMRQIENDPWTLRYRRLYEREDSLKTLRTLAQHLLYLNDPERIRVGHGAYLVGAFKLGAEADYLGPDDATSWYNRNLRIFSNLQHMTSGTDDRILLIVGAGHLPILRFLALSSPEYRLREPAEFLGRR